MNLGRKKAIDRRCERKQLREFSVLGIKQYRSAAVGGASGAPPGSASKVYCHDRIRIIKKIPTLKYEVIMLDIDSKA